MNFENINILSIDISFSEGDKLCGRLYQKLSILLTQKIMMDHMPLLMVCLEVILFRVLYKIIKTTAKIIRSFLKQGLGKLAEKFPNIAGTSISYLRDFLILPSPILSKLYTLAQQKRDREPFKIVGKFQNVNEVYASS